MISDTHRPTNAEVVAAAHREHYRRAESLGLPHSHSDFSEQLRLPYDLWLPDSDALPLYESAIRHGISLTRLNDSISYLCDAFLYEYPAGSARLRLWLALKSIHLESLVEVTELARDKDLPSGLCIAMMVVNTSRGTNGMSAEEYRAHTIHLVFGKGH